MKKLTMCLTLLCLMGTLTLPANAAELTIDAPGGPEYAKATSVEQIYTADRGERPNTDLSKNTALIPPTFGSPTSYVLGVGTPLTPDLTGSGTTAVETVIGGNSAAMVFPGITPTDQAITVTPSEPVAPTYGYTKVTGDLAYSGGYLGTLKIPSLGVSVKVYQGTGSSVLAKGAGHFEDTSIWEGNVCVAGHNRGVNCYFGDIHTLSIGDKITLTTKLGTRTYKVTTVSKISELDNSMLAPSTDNRITLFTCVKGQSSYRWAVQAVETV